MKQNEMIKVYDARIRLLMRNPDENRGIINKLKRKIRKLERKGEKEE